MSRHTILFLAANPYGTYALALDEEARAVQVELERCGHRDRFDLVTRWAVRPLDLLRDLRKLKPTIVHFSGHGGRLASSGHRPGGPLGRDVVIEDHAQGGQDGLFFQGPDGWPRCVSAEALQKTFSAAGSSVRLVVLSACYSSAQAEALRSHVDCVVGMRSAINDDAARSFAVGFYGGLGDGESVAAAFEQGRAAIGLAGLHDSDRPQLHLRAGVDASGLVLAAAGDTSTTVASSAVDPPASAATPSTPPTIETPIPGDIQAELDAAAQLTELDRYTEVIPLLERLLAAAEISGHAMARATVRIRLANALSEGREDCARAEQLFREALAIVPPVDLGNRHVILNGLTDMLTLAGRLDEANAAAHHALDLATRTGKADDLAGSLVSLSMIERRLGLQDSADAKLDEAIQHLHKQALLLPGDKDCARFLGVCYINKAGIRGDAGKSNEALAMYRKAADQHRLSGDKLNAGKVHLFEGELHCRDGRWREGFDCFKQALSCFGEAQNVLWAARTQANLSRLYATHQQWEKASSLALLAAAAAQHCNKHDETVRYMSSAARLFLTWATSIDRADAEDQATALEEHGRSLLRQAIEIAEREHLYEEWANCLLDEAREVTKIDKAAGRHKLIVQAIPLLTKALVEAQSVIRRGDLSARLGELHYEIDERSQAMDWLARAADIFEQAGDVNGLARLQLSLADMQLVEHKVDDAIASCRRAMSLAEGRSFNHIKAEARIKLAAALMSDRRVLMQVRTEVRMLLDEAEALCEQHCLTRLFSAMRHQRETLEVGVQAAQAPTQTLAQLLASLQALIEYRPEHAVSYLSFWYYAWHTELMSMLRSGARLSFMVVTDDAERFVEFAAICSHLADHFLMVAPPNPKVVIATGVLPIPPGWNYPDNLPLVLLRDGSPPVVSRGLRPDGTPREARPIGPTVPLPPYVPISEKTEIDGETHVRSLYEQWIPQPAIDLMLGHATQELIERRAIWAPVVVDPETSDDVFLEHLHISHDREVFPVYFDRLPASENVADRLGAEILAPSQAADLGHAAFAGQWRRGLLKLARVQGSDAETVLLDLQNALGERNAGQDLGVQIEVHLFEFAKSGKRVTHPVVLVRPQLGTCFSLSRPPVATSPQR